MKKIFFILFLASISCSRKVELSPPIISISTTEISDITADSAKSGGTIEGNGSTIIAKGVCWNESGTPTTQDFKTQDGEGSAIFTSEISSLSAITTYYVRAYVESMAGTVYGEEKVFFTKCGGDAYIPDENSDGDLIVYSQEQLMDFYYGGYTRIIGDLSIGIDIDDLSPLMNLTCVEGNVYIYDKNVLNNINGLHNLIYVSGSFNIHNNAIFTNLECLEHLEYIGGYFQIYNSHNLINLDGINQLSYVGENLYIDDNISLENLDGLERLTKVDGFLQIKMNPFLTNLNGLNNLTSIGDEVNIHFNNALTSLNGLENLSYVGFDLNIESNTNLSNLCGIKPLLSLGDFTGNYSVFGNAYNPTQDQIIEGNCSQE